MSVVVVPSSAVNCRRHNLLSLSTSIAKEGLRLHLHHSSPVRVSLQFAHVLAAFSLLRV